MIPFYQHTNMFLYHCEWEGRLDWTFCLCSNTGTFFSLSQITSSPSPTCLVFISLLTFSSLLCSLQTKIKKKKKFPTSLPKWQLPSHQNFCLNKYKGQFSVLRSLNCQHPIYDKSRIPVLLNHFVQTAFQSLFLLSFPSTLFVFTIFFFVSFMLLFGHTFKILCTRALSWKASSSYLFFLVDLIQFHEVKY